MSPLMSILRAAHCRCTHHHVALDATRFVETPAAQRLTTILLSQHEKYLAGAIDPDTRFRDFQNHVVHVNDGYWGGAPRLAIQWYGRLKAHLVADRYPEAAYAMGVLSHYFTDPLQPLHTVQHPRESLIHRPLEQSIQECYDELLAIWANDDLRLVFHFGDGDGWLGEAILKGAQLANLRSDALIDQYDLDRGVERPREGLNESCKLMLAELLGLAITGLARVMERVAAEAEAERGGELPQLGLMPTTLWAVLQIPEKLLLARLESRRERAAIDALIGEYRRTGKLVNNVPTEVFIKQKVIEIRQREVQWSRQLEVSSQLPRVDAGEKNDQREPDERAATIPFGPARIELQTGDRTGAQRRAA